MRSSGTEPQSRTSGKIWFIVVFRVSPYLILLIYSTTKRYSFNDAEVKQFDPNQFGSECFDGEMSSRT